MLPAFIEGMKWVEEIRVRTHPRREKELMEALLEVAASITRNKQLQSALVFSHYSAPGGFSLFLTWDTASVPLQGSDTAILIIEGFKVLGLLDHTVMVEKGDVKRKKPDGKQKPGHRR
jgi:hypothetical protein